MAEAKFGLKNVAAGSIQNGDVVFRTKDGVDLGMRVNSVKFSWAQGAGGTCSFKGPVETSDGRSLGEQTWTVPDGGEVTKRVPIAEADWD